MSEPIVKALAAQSFTKVEITSDGTCDGTTIMVNGKEVPDLKSFNLSLYCDDGYKSCSIGYSTEEACEPGTISGRTYWRVIPNVKACASQVEASSIVPSKTIPVEHLPRGSAGAALYAQM